MTAIEPPATIGFVGLGNMGAPMVRRLVAAGFELTVFDTSADAVTRLAELDRVTPASSLDAVAGATDAVVTMLPSSDVVDGVLIDGGVLERLRPEAVVIDMSSSEPSRTVSLAAVASRHDVAVVDAPVSGGVPRAIDGTLTIMVGGDPEPVARVQPILAELGASIVHVGGTGAGHATKAVNNLMSATHLLGASEAITAAIKFGIDPHRLLEVVNSSSGRSGSTELKWPRYVLAGTYDSGFGLGLMVKDVRIALSLLNETKVPHELSDRVEQLWSRAADDLPPDADHTDIARWVLERASIDATALTDDRQDPT